LKIVEKSQTRNKNGKNVSELGYPGIRFGTFVKNYKKWWLAFLSDIDKVWR
jgi:hypothetical protein